MIIAINTASAETELSLVADATYRAKKQWNAGRELSHKLLTEVQTLLNENNLELSDLTGIVVCTGPGSYTGLRIGISVANALAYALGIPVYGVNDGDWGNMLTQKLLVRDMQFVTPEYGGQPHITAPRK